MRIAFFTETFLPKIDGVVNTLCHLLDYLAGRGHASLLFAPEGGPGRYAQTPVIGLPGVSLPIYPELKIVLPHIDVSRHLTAFRPDLIHIINPVSLGLAGLNQAQHLHVPVVASYHTDIPGFAMRWGFGVLRDPFWTYFRWLHNQADLNLCPSTFTEAELISQGFERTKIWSRGVDIERFNPHHRSAEWRNRLTGGRPESPLLLCVSRLSLEKRLDWLRPALAALPQARLAIVGDGPARSDLERLFAATPTIFTGYLRGHDLACAYAAADVFVFPAANETFGNVALEAMASGVPVVAARSGGVLDHVLDRQTGLLFDPESQADLAAAVAKLITNPWLARSLGKAARQYAENKNWAAVFDKLLDDYAALVYKRAPETILLRQAA